MRNNNQILLLGTLLSLIFACCEPIESVDTLDNDDYSELIDEAEGHLEDFGLSCELENVSQGHEASIRMTIRNDSSVDVNVFAWYTPWDKNSNVFAVKNADSNVEYKGPLLNRLPPTEEAFVSIPYGEERSAVYDLKWYRPTEQDEYEISMIQPTMTVRTINGEYLLQHNCGNVHAAFGASGIGVIEQSLLEPYPDCTSSQKAKINRVIDGALQLASAAVLDIASNNTYAMKRWFGESEPKTKSTYAWMLEEDEYIRCGGSSCDGNRGVVVDYIFDEKLRLCPALWELPYLGMQSASQVETLVHELAHLVDSPMGSIVDWDNPSCVGFSDNKCYDYPNSLHLATHCTRCAQRNTDNYVGFAVEAFMRPALFTAIL